MFNLKTHLKHLVNVHAPSGFEAPAAAFIKESWGGLVDEFQTDRMGSLIGLKRATISGDNPRKIMLSAHMDEIALIVRDVVDGFILVHNLAGVDSRLMLAQPVIVHGKQPLPGLVAEAPPHLMSAQARAKYPPVDDLVIDVGLDADVVEELVTIGDLVVCDAPVLELLGGRLAGKSMDNRAGVASLSVCLHELQKMQHQWDVYAVAAAQEETGYIGAVASAYQINPDIAVVVDVGFAPQPGVPVDDAIEMDQGASIGFGANCHPMIYDKLWETARRHEIKAQVEVFPAATGTEAWGIQLAREGIPTALLSIPIRNMHSPIETVSLKDIERTGRLMAHFIADLEPDFSAETQVDLSK